jgi:hypothetical protein
MEEGTFNFDEFAEEASKLNSREEVMSSMQSDMDRVRDRMDERRVLMEAQAKTTAIQSKLCDKIRADKMSRPGLADRVAAFEDSDRELFNYIRKLEWIQYGIWCPNCDAPKRMGGRAEAEAEAEASRVARQAAYDEVYEATYTEAFIKANEEFTKLAKEKATEDSMLNYNTGQAMLKEADVPQRQALESPDKLLSEYKTLELSFLQTLGELDTVRARLTDQFNVSVQDFAELQTQLVKLHERAHGSALQLDPNAPAYQLEGVRPLALNHAQSDDDRMAKIQRMHQLPNVQPSTITIAPPKQTGPCTASVNAETGTVLCSNNNINAKSTIDVSTVKKEDLPTGDNFDAFDKLMDAKYAELSDVSSGDLLGE